MSPMHTARHRGPLRSCASALIWVVVAFAMLGGRAAAHSMAVEGGSGQPVEVFSGTVLAVHIDNKVTGRSFIHRELRIDSGGALTLHGAVAEDLQDGARVRLSARRSGNAIEALDGEVLAYSTRSSSAVDIRGVLAVAHADDFANGHSRYAYEMHDDLGGVTKLNVASLPGEIH